MPAEAVLEAPTPAPAPVKPGQLSRRLELHTALGPALAGTLKPVPTADLEPAPEIEADSSLTGISSYSGWRAETCHSRTSASSRAAERQAAAA